MKTLPIVSPTSEQLLIISQNQLGVELIRGAAGSGKTTTALMRLRSLSHMIEGRKSRKKDSSPIRALVLTFNRTLAGYVRELANGQASAEHPMDLEVNTFAGWATSTLNRFLDVSRADRILDRLAHSVIELPHRFVVDEIEYLLGRFEPENLQEYVETTRTGRGTYPRVNQTVRRKILEKVVTPYMTWLRVNNEWDWNSLAVEMGRIKPPYLYDIVIIDETQDFSANQLRAVNHHLATEHCLTLVIDTVQRIYARGFTWLETGISVDPSRSFKLRDNHRNTKQIAAFAAGILDGLAIDDDGQLPSINSAHSTGPLPTVLKGRYLNQAQASIKYINEHVDLTKDSVAFLKITGGNWFSRIQSMLRNAGIGFAKITRTSQWPQGTENVALSTFHSAKGLEFDHVFIIGLSSETASFGDPNRDDRQFMLRKLLAVAVTRARKTLVVGYKPGEASELVTFFGAGTFVEREV